MTSALEGAGSLVIRRETPSEYEAVEYLTREAFWNVYRPGCNEHYVLHTFRDNPDFVPELDLVLERDGRLIGHIMYARATIQADDGRTIPVMTFGPISIHPDAGAAVDTGLDRQIHQVDGLHLRPLFRCAGQSRLGDALGLPIGPAAEDRCHFHKISTPFFFVSFCNRLQFLI